MAYRPAMKSLLLARPSGVSGCQTPAAQRSRDQPTIALNSSVSQSLTSLPLGSSFQLFGTRNTPDSTPPEFSPKLAGPAMPQRLSCGRVIATSIRFNSSASFGALLIGIPAFSKISGWYIITLPIGGRADGIA